MTTGSEPISPAHRTIRGTQSLVGVMSFVWKHPSLTLLEILWRWLAAGPMLWLAWHALHIPLAAVPVNSTALAGMTFFEPVRSTAVLAQQVRLYLPAIRAVALWWIPLAFALWALLSGLGRYLVLRRAEPTLRPRPGWIILFSLLRSVLYTALLALWWRLVLSAVRLTLIGSGMEENSASLVVLTAELVLLTFLCFMLWSTTVWALDLRPLRKLSGRTEATAAQRRDLRSKLIETNLVMGIVRVILFVLALTFSASPLPFQSRETQSYINIWWCGVAVWYILTSDFFHVVRRVTYLRLLQSIVGERQ
jgi:hypothetical protein